MRPILSSSCARAATAAEARFRIDTPIAPCRGAWVVALDSAAGDVVARVSRQPWTSARFSTGPGWAANGSGAGLAERMDLIDLVVMVATGGESAGQERIIGEACARRGVMAAGVVLGNDPAARAAVAGLRPYARILMVAAEEADIAEILRAVRA